MKPIVLFALVLTASGCASTRSGRTTTVKSRSYSVPDLPTDPALEASLAMVNPRTIEVGAMRAAEVDLRNTANRALDFECAVQWYDHKGARVPLTGGTWARVALSANSQRTLRFEPMPREARSWRLFYRTTG